jgi:hypothetical protein
VSITVDKLGVYDNVRGVFADLDDGGLTDDEAIAKIRDLVDAKKPLPDRIVLMGTLPFTVTIDTRTKEITEFEINYEFPLFEQKAETRKTGDEIEIDEERLSDLIETASRETGDWPEPERA